MLRASDGPSSSERLDFHFVPVRSKCQKAALIGSKYDRVMLIEALEDIRMWMVKLILVAVRDERELRTHLVQKFF